MSDNQWFSLDLPQSLVFARNLDLFREREPEQASLVESCLSRLGEYEFLRIGKEQYICRERGQIEPFYDSADFQTQLKNRFDLILRQFQSGRELVLVAGSCLGYLAALTEQAIRGNYKQGVLLLENRPELIAAQFSFYDCRQLIRSNQVFWAVGESLFNAAEFAFAKFRIDLVPANKIVPVQERWLNDSEKREIQRIGGWLTQCWNEKQANLAHQKSQFMGRMSHKPNLESGTIWAMSSRDAYAHNPLIRSLAGGFEELGFQSSLFYLRDGFGDAYRLAESLMETSPDLILLCNTSCHAFFSQNVRRPFIDWFLDHPRYYADESFRNSLCSLDFVFYIDKDYERELDGSKAGHNQFLPACASILHKGERREKYAAPVLFVGAYQNTSHFYQTLSTSVREEIEETLDFLIENPRHRGSEIIISRSRRESTLELIRKNARDHAGRVKEQLIDEARQIDYFLYSLANNRKRERIVRGLLDLGIVIYGPDSWLNVLGEKYATQYRGWISGDELSDAYASADVVLNIHSLQCPTCLNPRDFDVLAAGGCLLADWVEDMEKGIFEPGRDCIAVRTVHEYKEAIQKLLNDPVARESLREEGHSTYLARHTPRHRAEEILSVIRGSQFL